MNGPKQARAPGASDRVQKCMTATSCFIFSSTGSPLFAQKSYNTYLLSIVVMCIFSSCYSRRRQAQDAFENSQLLLSPYAFRSPFWSCFLLVCCGRKGDKLRSTYEAHPERCAPRLHSLYVAARHACAIVVLFHHFPLIGAKRLSRHFSNLQVFQCISKSPKVVRQRCCGF